jgi:DNA repair protein RadC
MKTPKNTPTRAAGIGKKYSESQTDSGLRFIVEDFSPKAIPGSHSVASYEASSPDKICEFYRDYIETDLGYEKEKEHVVVICFNTKIEITGWHMVSIGSLAESTCHPREVLRPVIVKSSHAFVLCHNHPSGNPSPSQADRAMTKRINQAADTIGIEMLDHVIIGDSSAKQATAYSFAAGHTFAAPVKIGGAA